MNSRKQFLISGSAAIALPALEAFGIEDKTNPSIPRNFVAVGSYLGWHREAFTQKKQESNIKHQIP